MKKKIFRAIVSVSTAIVAVAFIGVFILLYETYVQVQYQELAKQTDLIAGMVEETGAEYLKVLDDSSYRLNWISPEGEVLYDSSGDTSSLSNHLGREEIREASIYGTGQATRYSDTLARETYNIAQKLSDGSFIRVSVTMSSIYGLFGQVLGPFLILLILICLISLILARRLSRSIVQPILAIDLDCPLADSSIPEIQPLLERIEQSNEQIAVQMEELQMKSREFETVSSNMDEGLILITDSGKMMSANQAACRIFGIDQKWKPADADYLPEMLAQARENGRATQNLHKKSRDYIVEVSAIYAHEALKGYIILVLDITEKVEARERRQEFTANVTHELKTPIQTIMASTELLENGTVRQEDQKRFLHYISKEARRLVDMINDIIQLSRLDAGHEEPQEVLDLAMLAEEIAESIRPAADASRISMDVSCEEIYTTGSRKMWQSIFSNLMENALKYNKPYGTIQVNLYQEESAENAEHAIVFQVTDTGIGIPDKYQDRVFERFFRVDKSHSSTVGGSGLGLAIVAHAVEDLHGWIRLESTEGKGTTITVRIPDPSCGAKQNPGSSDSGTDS